MRQATGDLDAHLAALGRAREVQRLARQRHDDRVGGH